VAKKTRTPAPPRPVQAPQRRKSGKAKAGAAGDERKKWMLFAFAASGIVGLAIVAAVVVLTSGSSNANAAAVPDAMKAAGCTYKTVKATSRDHVQSLNAKIKYLTSPPTSGKHYAAPATWGFYTSPANPIQVVHNEEHGGVILWWGSKVPSSTVDKLHSFYSSSPNAMVGTPYASLGSKVAISAWTAPSGGMGTGHLAVCTGFNEKAFKTFRDAFRGKGPERFPVSILTPGA
jgi:hypothetical protein